MEDPLDDALVFYQPVLGEAPDVIDSVDAVARVVPPEEPALDAVHSVVVPAAPVDEVVVGGEPICVHVRVLRDLALDDLHERFPAHIGRDPCAGLLATLEEPTSDHLSSHPSPAHAPDAVRPEVALIRLDLSLEGSLCLTDLGEAGLEEAVAAFNRVSVRPASIGGRQRPHVGAEGPQQLPASLLRKVRSCDAHVPRCITAARCPIPRPF